MISKCANPECSVPFRYLRDGKLFRVDLEHLTSRHTGQHDSDKAGHRMEHFWLCGRCASTMTLVAEKGGGITVAPSHECFARRLEGP
jgi:hypothetical protein